MRQSRPGVAPPLPLAGEGWGEGAAASPTVRVERAAPTRIASVDAIRPKSELCSSRPPQAGEVERFVETLPADQLHHRRRKRLRRFLRQIMPDARHHAMDTPPGEFRRAGAAVSR